MSFTRAIYRIIRPTAAVMLTAFAVFFISPTNLHAEPVSTPSSMPAPNDTVYAVAVATDGTVYIGGEFTQVGGQNRNHVAAISSSGQLLSWNPDVNGPVYAILVSDDTIIFGGSFTTVSGQARNNIAVTNNLGQISDWDPNINGAVNAIALDAQDTVYIGGEFTQVEGQARNNAAAILDSAAVASWNPNINGAVAGISIDGTSVYLAGDFTQVGVQSRNRAAMVTTGGTVSSWNPNVNDVVGAVYISGTTAYLVGDFTQVGGQARNFAAAVGKTDGALLSWNPDPNQSVLAISGDATSLYLGGFFSQIDTKLRNNAAAVSSSGAASSWNPNFNGPVASIAVSGTTVYVAGNFTQVGGQASPYVAKFVTSGSPTPYPTPYATPTTPYPTPTTPYATPTTPYPTPTGLPYPTPVSGGQGLDDIADQLEEGDLISFNDQFPVYYVTNDFLYPFATTEGLVSYMQQSGEEIIDVVDDPTIYADIISSQSAESLLSSGSGSGGGSAGSTTQKFATGSLVADAGTVYLIMGNKKIAFTSFNAFNGLGYSLKNVVTGNLSGYTLASTYWIDSASMPHPWGSWVRYNHTVYYVHQSGLIGVPSQAIFKNNGGKDKYVMPINQADIDSLNFTPNLPVMQNNDSRVYK